MIHAAAVASLDAGVEALMRRVGETVVMPRFRALAPGEIIEKTPGELVTIADREAEAVLTTGLAALLPHSRVVGEEACAADPALLAGLSDGLLWIVDPIDGTGNFVRGEAPFGIIVALAVAGVTVGGWILDPLSGRFCRASAGGGARLDGRRVTTPTAASPPTIALATQFMPAAARTAVLARAHAAFTVVPIPRCAAEHYPRLALGQNDVAVFQRTLPWDHAAGALFLTEAGGRVTRWNGQPYRFHDDGIGILAASTDAAWRQAMDALHLDGIDDAATLLPQRPAADR